MHEILLVLIRKLGFVSRVRARLQGDHSQPLLQKSNSEVSVIVQHTVLLAAPWLTPLRVQLAPTLAFVLSSGALVSLAFGSHSSAYT